MRDKALQSEKIQDNPANSRTVGNSVYVGSSDILNFNWLH